MPWWIQARWSLALIGVGILVALVTKPDDGYFAPFIVAGVLWALSTGRARKTYWNARLRARAYRDERESRS